MTAAEHGSDLKLKTDTPYLTLTDEPWGVRHEEIGENWLETLIEMMYLIENMLTHITINSADGTTMREMYIYIYICVYVCTNNNILSFNQILNNKMLNINTRQSQNVDLFSPLVKRGSSPSALQIIVQRVVLNKFVLVSLLLMATNYSHVRSPDQFEEIFICKLGNFWKYWISVDFHWATNWY